MARTTAALVAGVLVDASTSASGQGDYDGSTDLTPYIDAASSVVDDLEAADEDGDLSSAKLEIIERWLAAHYYTIMDPIYMSKTTMGRSASFQQRSYLDVAKQLDPTGMLEALVEGKRAKGFWLGRAQDQYADENEVVE